jgi:hypothetical protein
VFFLKDRTVPLRMKSSSSVESNPDDGVAAFDSSELFMQTSHARRAVRARAAPSVGPAAWGSGCSMPFDAVQY